MAGAYSTLTLKGIRDQHQKRSIMNLCMFQPTVYGLGAAAALLLDAPDTACGISAPVS
jgi:hypothetical protein